MAKKKFNIKGLDSAVRMFAPKAVTIGVNILRMGPRMIFRSTVQLLRANLLTRILSCLTLLALDLADLCRHRISKAQFLRNIILSLLLVAGGTFGWNIGIRWIVFEMLGSSVEILGGMAGAGVCGTLSGVAFDKVCSKFVRSDAQKMWDIINPHLSGLPAEEQVKTRKKITSSDLKKMFASKDKEAYAGNLIQEYININREKTMRLDKYLKVSRLIKRRTVAGEACDGGRVSVNGKVAKPAYDVKTDDVIEISFGGKKVKVKVLEVKEHVRKEEADAMYEVLEQS